MTTTLSQPVRLRGPAAAAGTPACLFCGAALRHTFVDLGMSPLCESFLTTDQLDRMEPFYPLHVRVCDRCWLVQLPEYVSGQEIFTEYAYFSSYADSWLAHARAYTAQMIDRFGLTGQSQVIEVGSNDGYLLQYFVQRGIPVLGIEPAANVARAALERGVPTQVRFFGRETARDLITQGRRADLLAGANVLAQIPDLNDFVVGLNIVLAPQGVITIEFPHLMSLVEGNEFDTIYHEHYSYFSLISVEKIFGAHGLTVFDVDELPTHGGSLRIYAKHDTDSSHPVTEAVVALRQRELDAGLNGLPYYASFSDKVQQTKRKLLDFLVDARRRGKRIAGYGAPGKGNTLLNYCGIRTDFLDFTVDRNPYKHGRYTPGTRIPIHPPSKLAEAKPDYVLILPWNLRDEIMSQHSYIREWGGQFVVPIPELRVYR